MDTMERMFYNGLNELLKSVKNDWWQIKISDAEKLFKVLLDIEGVKIFGRDPNGLIYPMVLREGRSLHRLAYILNKWYESKDPNKITNDPEKPIIYIIGEEDGVHQQLGQLQLTRP